MRTLWRDIRFGVRTLLKNPLFSAVAVLSLALAIGANTVMFSIVDGVLLRNLPYRNPDRLVSIFGQAPGSVREKSGLSTAEFLRIREVSQSLAQVEGLYGTYQVTYR